MKDSHKTFRIYRVIAHPLLPIFVRSGLTPNQISILRLLIFVPISILFLSFGGYVNGLIGLTFYHIFKLFDVIDGGVARIRSMQSKAGHWLDAQVDFFGNVLIIIGLSLNALKGSSDIPFIGIKTIQVPIEITFLFSFFALVGFCCIILFSRDLEYQYAYFSKRSSMMDKEQGKRSLIKTIFFSIIFLPTFLQQVLFFPTYVVTFGILLGQPIIPLSVLCILNSMRAIMLIFIDFKLRKEKEHNAPLADDGQLKD